MPGLDIFDAGGFECRELTDAVNLIPNAWGDIDAMGVFTPRPIRTTNFQVEERDGVLTLITSSSRSTPAPGTRRPKRALRPFATSRFALKAAITADDIQNIRAFGSQTELVQVMGEVAERQAELRGNMDITREYLRAGALQGVVKDADGSTLVNLFTDFGITQKVVDFTLGSATGFTEACAEVSRHIRKNMRGDVMTGIACLVTPTAWDKLMRNADFRDAYKYFKTVNGANPLRGVDRMQSDVGAYRKWFEHEDITWIEYLAEGDVPQEDGTVVTTSFIPDGDMRFFPIGTRTTFRDVNAPADYIEVANTLGEPFYSKIDPDTKSARRIEVEVQSQTMPMCYRPGVLVRGHSGT